MWYENAELLIKKVKKTYDGFSWACIIFGLLFMFIALSDPRTKNGLVTVDGYAFILMVGAIVTFVLWVFFVQCCGNIEDGIKNVQDDIDEINRLKTRLEWLKKKLWLTDVDLDKEVRADAVGAYSHQGQRYNRAW